MTDSLSIRQCKYSLEISSENSMLMTYIGGVDDLITCLSSQYLEITCRKCLLQLQQNQSYDDQVVFA